MRRRACTKAGRLLLTRSTTGGVETPIGLNRRNRDSWEPWLATATIRRFHEALP